jgi:hypothetical protein
MHIYIFKNFCGVKLSDPFLQQVEGMREGDSWERRVEEGRGMCGPNKTLE